MVGGKSLSPFSPAGLFVGGKTFFLLGSLENATQFANRIFEITLPNHISIGLEI